MKERIKLTLAPMLAVVATVLTAPLQLQAQSFDSYGAGDDVTSSLGQFQLVLDQAWRPTFDLIMPNSPLGNTMVTRHIKLYHKGTLTSPTLYDPQTTIGRSDAFVSGAPQETAGALAGRAPGRTFVRDSQMTVHPAWPEPTNGAREVHTFLKSMHLTDSFTTQVGFSVKAGMQAPTRPVCAGQVEGGSPSSDFPANSFFNVYVVVDLPSGGLLPPIQLVNVDPLLVQQTNIFSFPPRIVYQHENSTAVSMYFNKDVIITNPATGAVMPAPRGTLFGQLTLAGHGVSFSSSDIDTFQTEIETESETNTMPVNPAPTTSVVIQDFAPDYNAVLPTLSPGQFASNGSFIFTANNLLVNATNYLQVRTNLTSDNWHTIATVVPATSTFTFVDPDAASGPQRYYRWSEVP